MKTHPAAAAVALALVAASIVPATSAVAADNAVTGTITLDGSPIGGVEVGWYDPTTDAAGETVADGAGAYSLTVPDGHPYVLYAGIDHKPSPPVLNHGAWESVGGSTYVGVFAGANGQDYLYQNLTAFTTPLTAKNIDLDKPGSITGTSSAFAKKRVSIGRTNGTPVRSAKADASGHFEVTGLIPGLYTVSVDPIKKYAFYESPTLTVAAGAATTLVPKLVEPGTITGVITNKGKPVAGVNVQSFLDNGYGAADTTDAHGRYTLANENPGTYDIYLAPGSDDGGLVNRPILQKHLRATVVAGKAKKLDIAVKKGGSVSGSVVPVDTTSGLQQQVVVLDKNGELLGGTSVSAVKKGVAVPFTIKAVQTGTATLYVTDGRSKVYGSVPVTVTGGRNVAVGTVRMTKKTVAVSGSVSGVSKGTVGFGANAYGVSQGSAKIKHGKYTITGLLPVAGTVALSGTSTRLARVVHATPGGKRPTTLTPGAARPTLTATFMAGNFPLWADQGSIWLPGEHEDLGEISIHAGVTKVSRLEPGTGYLKLASFDMDSSFVSGSPFWIAVPRASAKMTLRAGKTTDLGVVAVNIHR